MIYRLMVVQFLETIEFHKFLFVYRQENLIKHNFLLNLIELKVFLTSLKFQK